MIYIYKRLFLLLVFCSFSIGNLRANTGIPDSKPVGKIRSYPSMQSEGLIGMTEESPIDNPVDNIFHVNINESLCGNEKVWLTYELEGVADHTSVSRSINDQVSVGGY